MRYFFGILGFCWSAAAADFPEIKNTQKPGEEPPPPAESVDKMTLPDGFSVSLVAGEPDLHQPIAFDLDDRGRIWVIENYTYKGRGFNPDYRDRIAIFDKGTKKIFWDQGDRLTSFLHGFGGLFILNAGTLSFIADKTGDDKPDGPPKVLLDGFEADKIAHNVANGLMWGPDGWIYGRHGIQATSKVGKPGTPDSRRTSLNCSIWRYHPVRQTFEVVAQGTTNPWGLDYNDEGEFFFSNNVVGHFYHLIPGAHYKRMYGEDFNPYVYELMDICADHYHYDTGKGWGASRDAAGKSDALGGGHSHCGGLFYLSDDWPVEYRNTFLMINTHGRRINRDIPERQGAGYVAKHGKDFLFANSPWFRGVELRLGPDGSVFMSDWTDLGECHDHDGIHRTSGRLYKISYGKPEQPAFDDLNLLSSEQLADMQLHHNEFFVRRARRILMERALQNGGLTEDAYRRLFKILEHEDHTRRLRAMWCLYLTGLGEETLLRRMLNDPNEHVQAWAVRLLMDGGLLSKLLVGDLYKLTAKTKSGLVQLHLASVLPRFDPLDRMLIAEELLRRTHDNQDPVLTRMLWYGIEPMVGQGSVVLTLLMEHCKKRPLLRRLLVRRATESYSGQKGFLKQDLAIWDRWADDDAYSDIMQGMAEALRGRRGVKPPTFWNDWKTKFESSKHSGIQRYLRELAGVFGDGEMMQSFQEIAADQNAGGQARRNALKALVENPTPELRTLFMKLVGDFETSNLAIRGLAAYDHKDIPKKILGRYWRLDDTGKTEAVNTLSSRPNYATALLEALGRGEVKKAAISAFHAQQMHRLNDERVNQLLAKHWGKVQPSSEEKHAQIKAWKEQLTPEILAKADRSKGRLVFEEACVACHTLYGQGGTIGPDLTGGNRDNLDYLLENTIDPNAVLGDNFKTLTFSLKDGRMLLGAIEAQTEHVVHIRTQTEKVSVDRKEIVNTVEIPVSLMPEGLMEALTKEQVRNLIAYLVKKQQAPLPKEKP